MKSGTTSLYYYLRTPFHPGLGVPLKTTNKEPHFFNKVMDRLNGSDATEAWAKYLRLFPGVFEGDDPTSHKCSNSYVEDRALADDDAPAMVRMELTPNYLYNPMVPARVAQMLPEARFVVLLRNPASRAISNFNHRWRKKYPLAALKLKMPNLSDRVQMWLRDLNETVEGQLSALERCYERLGSNAYEQMREVVPMCARFAEAAPHEKEDSIISIELGGRGVYVDQLSRWFSQFPRERFLIWVSEDFKETPFAHLDQLVSWVGLDPRHTSEEGREAVRERNAREVAADYPQTPSHTKERLYGFFRPHNERLFAFLEKEGFGAAANRMRLRWAPR